MFGAAEIAAFMSGAAVLLFALAAAQVSARAAATGRLRSFVEREAFVAPTPIKRQRAQPQPEFVEKLNRRLQRAKLARRLQAQIIRAGLDMPASRFMLIQGMVFSLAFVVTVMATARVFNGGPESLGLGFLVGAVAGFIPRYALRFKETARLRKFERQLAPTVDAMAGALQAGSSLPQAMEMVSREMEAPIGEEFAIVVRELAVGVPMQEAFENMLERVNSVDLDMLLTSINIQHRVGGNLSQILRSIAHTVRERLRIRKEIDVLTAQARISAWVVSALPVGLVGLLFVIAPMYIMKLFQPGIARALLALGVIGILAGFYAMRKIADIDV